MIDEEPEEESIFERPTNAKAEMLEQAMAVSEIAEKLEECSRKARKGGKTRKGAAGAITLPSGLLMNNTATGLLTYDDELVHFANEDLYNSGMVTQSEESSVAEEDSSATGDSSIIYPVLHESPPVDDPALAKKVKESLLKCMEPHTMETMGSSISVANFCMSNAPAGDEALCSKIIDFVTSQQSLLSDFQDYRSALHPEQAVLSLLSSSSYSQGLRGTSGLQTASRNLAVRDFKIYAVNCIHGILGRGGVQAAVIASEHDRMLLKHTANIWQRSAGQFA